MLFAYKKYISFWHSIHLNLHGSFESGHFLLKRGCNYGAIYQLSGIAIRSRPGISSDMFKLCNSAHSLLKKIVEMFKVAFPLQSEDRLGT